MYFSLLLRSFCVIVHITAQIVFETRVRTENYVKCSRQMTFSCLSFYCSIYRRVWRHYPMIKFSKHYMHGRTRLEDNTLHFQTHHGHIVSKYGVL